MLIERKGKLPGQMLGKSPWLQSVHIVGDTRVGDVVEVTLTAAGPNSLTGEPAAPATVSRVSPERRRETVA